MVITEIELRQLWQDGKNVLPSFPPGTVFSPAASDFLHNHQLDIRFEENSPQTPQPAAGEPGKPAWDRPAQFPVVFSGPAPVFVVDGQEVSQKPEHYTQIDAQNFGPKTDGRIKLRGRLDTLNALTMLVGAEARRYGLVTLAGLLDTLAAYCREILAAEYHHRPLAALQLGGMSEEDLHEISHHPERTLKIDHLTIGTEAPIILHWLNYLRATSREVEITALEADPAGTRPDLGRALNRFSSAVYVLELLVAAESGKM